MLDHRRRFRRKMSWISNSCEFECSKTNCASNNWPIWTQKVKKDVSYHFFRLFSKIFVLKGFILLVSIVIHYCVIRPLTDVFCNYICHYKSVVIISDAICLANDKSIFFNFQSIQVIFSSERYQKHPSFCLFLLKYSWICVYSVVVSSFFYLFTESSF